MFLSLIHALESWIVETEALHWFQQVSDGATVTEVADLAMVSQPGVSRALARLEHEVGTPLLERVGRVLRPTQAGQLFKRHVDAAMHHLDDGVAAVQQLLDPERGTVTLAFQLSFGNWLIPHVVRTFHAEHPDVEFRLEQSRDALGSSLVAQGAVDLEITGRRPRNPAVRWDHLFMQRLELAVPPDHRLAGAPVADLAEVAGDDFILLTPAWELRHLADQLCASAGFSPRVVFEGDDLPTLGSLVAAGLGVAILPQIPGATGSRARRVALSDPAATREIGLASSAERRLLPAAALFREHLLARRGSLLTDA
ncbi:MAG: LysR family transcriptional regulator [Nocardioidaceae bacterium]